MRRNPTKELLKAHQEIIDAWFAAWLKQERRRIDEAFRRGSESTPQAQQDAT